MFHSLRATFATQLALAGVPAQAAMQLLDHSSIQTTLKFYTMVGVSDMAGFMGRLPPLGSVDVGMAESMLG